MSDQTGACFDYFVYNGRSQFGQGLNFPVFQGCAKHGQSIEDIIRKVWLFFRPIIFNETAAALKAGGEPFKHGATVKEIITSTLKPTVKTVLATTLEQVANHFLVKKATVAPNTALIIGPPPGTHVKPLMLQA